MTTDAFSWATSLSEENRLYVIDLAEDMLAQLELGVADPAIRLWNQVIKYPQLHPGDGIQIRQNYMERRYRTAQLLERHGIVSGVDVPRGQSGYDVVMTFRGDAARVRALMAAVKASFPKPKSAVPQPSIEPFWKRFSGEFFALVLGIVLALAIDRSSWLYAALAILPLVGILRSMRIVPSWTGAWKAVVDLAVILGALAAIAQFLLDAARRGQ